MPASQAVTKPPPGAVAVEPADSPLAGIVYYCLAPMLFVCMGALVKYLSQFYPGGQIVWSRYFAHFLLILIIFAPRIPRLLVSRRKGLQVLRGVLMLTSTLCSFFALRFMPLADLSAVAFLAPLIVTGLSVVMLGEKVGPRRWTAVAIGFAGMLLILRPGAETVQWATLLPIGMAVLAALYAIVTRMVRSDADPVNALFYTALVGALLATPLLLIEWRTPDPIGWAMLLSLGVFGGLGHYFVILAFRRASASMLAPFAYTELIWATLMGLLIFGDFPDAWTFAGAGIITASGLYVLHRERVVRAREAAAAEP